MIQHPLLQILAILAPTHCIICKKTGLDVCKKCRVLFLPAKPQEYSWIISLWNYHDSRVETIVRHIKNVPNERIARILARIMKENISQEQAILVPIPISKDRFRERGYNQSLLLARALSKETGFPVCNALRKHKKTLKQGTTSSRLKRIQNMRNAFVLENDSCINNKNILLIDDVVTTGATLCEARKTLLAHGARSVSAITIAH